MSQHIESVSWKSHAAGTLAKRNQMLSSLRNGGGLLPTAASTAILDPAVFQARGRTAAQNVYNEDVGSAVADIISAGRSQQRANLAAGGEPESLQVPLSEGSGSRADFWEGSPSPTVLKALPPQRSRPSRVQSSRPQKQEQQSTLPSSTHLPPRVATDINRMHRQEPPPTLSSLLHPSSRATVTPAAPVHLAPLSFSNDPPHSKPPPEDQAFDQHGAEHLGRPYRQEILHDYGAEIDQELETTQSHTTENSSSATEFMHSGHLLPRVPSINPFIPVDPVKIKTPMVPLLLDDSDIGDDDLDKPRLPAKRELTAVEKMELEVLEEQLGHLLEAVKSKKLSGAVKIKHGINALRLAVHLHKNNGHIDTAFSDLQTILYKMAWDYHSLFFEAEIFKTLLDISVTDRCMDGSKLALQLLLVVFERDARVSGGAVRQELFDDLFNVIADCLSNENGDFQLGWGLWFLSYFATDRELARELVPIFPLQPMLELVMQDNTSVSMKYKIMQALRNLTAGSVEIQPELLDHRSFAPWLLRACAKNIANPTVEDRMLHVQTLGVTWNLCSSPHCAAKMLTLGVYDALAMVLEMPHRDTQEMALLALADIASTESGRLRLLDAHLAVSLCGLAKSLPPPTPGVLEGIMRVLFALSESEYMKSKRRQNGNSHFSTSASNFTEDSLNLDTHFFRSMGIVDVIGHLLRNGGEMTKLLALGTLINLCLIPKNIPLIRNAVGADVEKIANSLTSAQPLLERAQALTLVLNDRSRNSCVLM